jgi:hypothetical protein
VVAKKMLKNLTYGWSGYNPHAINGEPAHAQAEPALVEAEAVLRVTRAEQTVSLTQRSHSWSVGTGTPDCSGAHFS